MFKDHIVSSYFRREYSFFLDQLINQANIPGLGLAVINDGIVTVNCSGFRNRQDSMPVTGNTVFNIASLSKPVFAYAVLKLYGKGLFDLDRPLTEYIKEANIVGYDDIVKKNKNFGLITGRAALCHCTGLPNWSKWRSNKWSLNRIQPGKKIVYSGPGYFALSQIIQGVLQKEMNSIIAEEVFRPLGMNRSSYQWEESFRQNHATPYDGEGKPYLVNYERKCDVSGSMHSTIIDYSKFVSALIKSYYQKVDVSQMFEPQASFKSLYENIVSDFWGLGMPCITTPHGLKFWHWGEDNGFQTYFEIYPKEKKGFVYFTNSNHGISVNSKLASFIYNREIKKCSKAGKVLYNCLSTLLPPKGPLFEVFKYI